MFVFNTLAPVFLLIALGAGLLFDRLIVAGALPPGAACLHDADSNGWASLSAVVLLAALAGVATVFYGSVNGALAQLQGTPVTAQPGHAEGRQRVGAQVHFGDQPGLGDAAVVVAVDEVRGLEGRHRAGV